MTVKLRPVIVALLVVAPAWADVAPGPGPGPSPGPPPPECTAQRIAGPHDQCLDCGASYEQPNKCQELGAQGYRQACRAPGASVWNEVWCRSGSQPDRKRGCGACAVGSEDRSTSLVALGLMLAGALAWGARRR